MYKHAISLTCPDLDLSDTNTILYGDNRSCQGVTPGIDGNYFSIASLERLGTSQAVQFQKSGQNPAQSGSDYHWGSKYNESGAVIGTDSSCSNPSTGLANATYVSALGYCIEGNSRGDFPRSYLWSLSMIYSASAITAESLNASRDYLPKPSDSICPSGWKIPEYNNAYSWANLMAAYSVENNEAGSKRIKELPISITVTDSVSFTGYYPYTTEMSMGRYWTSYIGSGGAMRNLFFSKNGVEAANVWSRYQNIAARCVKK